MDWEGNTKDNLSYDEMSANFRPSVVVKVHKSRMLFPTYKGIWGNYANAERMRAREALNGRKALSVVLSSAIKELEVGVEIGDKGAAGYESYSDQIEVVYERWGFETGGFLALSNCVDSELVTQTDPADETKTQVLQIRDTDKWAQETGIFLSLIPRNYPFLSWGLGLATNPGRNPSVYFGPGVRLTGLGGRGIASFSAGVVERQVQEFPGIKVNESYASDSSALKGALRSRVGGYFLINLGFAFGQIGGGGNGGGGDSGK